MELTNVLYVKLYGIEIKILVSAANNRGLCPQYLSLVKQFIIYVRSHNRC